VSRIVSARPILWHIAISHYNEKARWALDFKGIEHDRHALAPGYHMVFTLAMTRGRHYTTPLLELDGQRIGDSTDIIAALERSHPEPALYPEDPVERRHALALEDYFDNELGPYVRRLVFHELRSDRAGAAGLARIATPSLVGRFPRLATEYFLTGTAMRYGTRSNTGAERARQRILQALDRLETELGPNDYLVGQRFTVADLTAASLLYPLVLPAEGPAQFNPPTSLAGFRDPLKRRRGFEWVEEMFHRHRNNCSRPGPSSMSGRSARRGLS
jgi:glutathione S-transferase